MNRNRERKRWAEMRSVEITRVVSGETNTDCDTFGNLSAPSLR